MIMPVGAPPGNTNRQIHGGEKALKNLQQGQEFASYAHETYLSILGDMGLDESDLTGTIGLLAKETARQLTISHLFWDAAMGSAQQGNLKAFTGFARRFGWMSSKGIKAMAAYFELAKDKNIVEYEDILKNGG
jgi:hypothetical protein